MTVSQEDWGQWVSSPATKAYIDHLNSALAGATEAIINADPGLEKDTLEQYGIRILTLRGFCDGVAQAADLESIKEAIVETKEEEIAHGY